MKEASRFTLTPRLLLLPYGWRNYEGTSVNWSFSQVVGRMLDAGSWGQGTHNIYILARASNGATSWGYGTFFIDNTPVVVVNSPSHVEGAFDITGTIQFKERVSGYEGSIEIYIDVMPPALPEGVRNYEGTIDQLELFSSRGENVGRRVMGAGNTHNPCTGTGIQRSLFMGIRHFRHR